ncbi:MAG: PHP domain-containing protein [Clostridia bacterium]|nr:PHP domain-containing protein [Clostridia bacterium]
MNPNLKKFKVIPSVVEANKESTVTVKAIDGIFKFYDDITYEVKFIPQEESDVPHNDTMSLEGFNENRKSIFATPENGELKLTYFFGNEQEWKIRIRVKNPSEYEKYQNPIYKKYEPFWGWLINAPKEGITLSVYSLEPDLYKRRALKGDLHIHSNASDGDESPEMVAASYRKAGFDFMALTDHNTFNTSKNAKEKLSFLGENFEILHGEEIHNSTDDCYAGYFHLVHIGGKYSINEIYQNNPERIEKEIAELDGKVEVPENVDKKEYLGRVWVKKEVEKAGGFLIFPHPYWNIGFYHIQTSMAKAILRNKLCDAFEVIGGCKPYANNMQVELYHSLRAEGVEMPVVGSSDSHSVLRSNTHFNKQSTIAFTENGDILKAIADGYSVAVEALPGENVRVYGNFRLMKYVHFLLETYFMLHNELCFASGLFLDDYIHGDDSAKELVLSIEKRITNLEKEFFGR